MLRLLKSSSEDGQNGQIINLLSSDLLKFEYALGLLHEVWKGPMQVLLFLVVIYYEIGASGIVGIAFIASFIPLQCKCIGHKRFQHIFNPLFNPLQYGWAVNQQNYA